MEFRLLGPVELWADGQVCEFGSTKERHVLAILLVSAGHPVSIETMIDRLWDLAPVKSRGSIHSYIARLRRSLRGKFAEAEVRIVSKRGAYAIDVDPERVDLHRFRRLNAQARAIADSGDEEEALRLFGQAEQLWRGEPLADLSGRWVSGFRASLEHDRHAALRRRLSVELDLGRDSDLVGELYDLVARYPYDESFVEYLMTALYRSGRQGDALDAYHRAWRRISDHLGTPPAQPLRDIADRILRGDSALATPPRRDRRARGAPLTDNLLRDTRDFTGRETELQRLYAALDTTPTAIAIEAIDGMAGIGKTALAIHVGHRLADRYPDGRLYLNLHAHDPNHPPIDPGDGLETLLRLIGEEPTRIPTTLEERAALWRDRLAKRRVFILLDDVASQDQVRPLLPGAPGCLVLITSRRRLTGLDGVRPLSLDVLGPEEATRLFRWIVGDRQPLDSDAVRQVVDLCGYLPLAIAITANQLRHRPARSVQDLVAKLSRAKDRLAEMRAGDSDLNTAFELSYRELSAEGRRAFRRLSLYVGADIATDAAAALVGCDRDQAERALEELIDFHLVEEPNSGRVRLHDLLRAYARERAAAEEPEEEPRAVRRLLDFYLYAADQADRTLHPYRHRDPLKQVSEPFAVPSRDAAEWLRTEHANLLSCVLYAAEHSFAEHAIQLPHILASYLERSAHWDDAIRVHEIARQASREAGDRRSGARAELELSLAYSRTGHYDTAFEHAQAAMEGFRALDDRRGMADTYDRLALLSGLSGRYHAALNYIEQALTIFRSTGMRHGQATALLHKGNALTYLRRTAEAVPVYEESLGIARKAEDPGLEAMILNNLGDIKIKRGYHRDALRLFRETLSKMREAGWRQNEAVALNNIADVHQYKGRYDEALHFYHQALSVYRETGDRHNEANVLNNIGTTHIQRERYAEALIHFQKALAIGQGLGDPHEQTRALHGIGEAHRENGRFSVARESYGRALAMARTAADPYLEARCFQGLGETAYRIGRWKAAETQWRRAVVIFDRLGLPEAELLHARLHALEAIGLTIRQESGS